MKKLISFLILLLFYLPKIRVWLAPDFLNVENVCYFSFRQWHFSDEYRKCSTERKEKSIPRGVYSVRVQCSGTLIIVYLSTELLSVPCILPVVLEKNQLGILCRTLKIVMLSFHYIWFSRNDTPCRKKYVFFLWLFEIFFFWLSVLRDIFEAVAETLVVPLLMYDCSKNHNMLEG